MKIDINQFWNLLTESQLVKVSQVQTLFSEFANESTSEKTVEALTKWLIQKKAISPYQAEIITAGHSGPFQFGSFTIQQRIKKGVLAGHFAARHTKTGHPVLLQFLPGSEPEHLLHWNQIESVCNKLEGLEHPNLATIFETAITPNYRFVVSQFPNGTSVADKLPLKSRLPWKKACAILAQAANGLSAIHKTGIVHNAISPRSIWLQKSGQAHVRFNPCPDPDFDDSYNAGSRSATSDPKHVPESKQDYYAPECYGDSPKLTQSADIYALGCTLVRMITGRNVFPAKDIDEKRRRHENEKPANLKKYEIPDELESLIQKMLAKNPADRPKSVSEIGNLLALLSGKAEEIKSQKISTSTSKKAYLRSVSQFLPGSEQGVASAPEIATEQESLSINPLDNEAAAADRAARIQAAISGAEKRKKGHWKIPAAVAAALLVLSGIIGLLALSANKTTVKKIPTKPTVEPPADSEPIETTEVPKNRMEELAALPPEERPAIFQELIDDNGSSLWESPTEGPPVDFSFLPVAPKMLFHFRVSELAEHPEGQLLMRSFGPAFESRITQFTSECGLDLENIERLTISLHANESSEYEPYFLVKTNVDIEIDRLRQLWNQPALRRLENQQRIFESSTTDIAYYVLPTPTAGPASNDDEENTQGTTDELTESPKETTRRFAFGSKSIIEEVAQSAGANVLSGSLRTLAEQTDGNRHFNVLWLRNSLFNDQGQNLMGASRSTFNRELAITTPDEVRGGLMSLHISDGTYFELSLDRNFDLKANELRDMMESEFRSRRESITSFVAKIPSSSYWDQVRLRYDNMLTDLNRNLRWDVEFGTVTANCWLPPMAAHNLIAASELVISFSKGVSNAPVATKKVPQSLDALLAIKRDLNIANPPDLNVLLAELQTEVVDDSGKLPFAFNIRLIGGDLEKEGITKNQRPSELVLEQQTLSDILTSIMVKANPNKDITGASDPNCKLIWVIADDPEIPGEKAILVTTRAAAAEKSYTLPPAFRNE